MNDSEYEQAVKNKFSMVEYRKEHHDEKRGKRYLHKSLSVGDQTSQITAIAFPTPIDKLVTIVCGCKYYGRYMDDLYVIARTKEELIAIKQRIEDMAGRLKIIINPKKTVITKLSRTFVFLQFKYYLTNTGHVVIRVNPKTVTRMRRKLKKLRKRVDSGTARLVKVEEMFRSWIANYGPMLSNKQRENLIKLYRELFKGGLDEWLKKRKFM